MKEAKTIPTSTASKMFESVNNVLEYFKDEKILPNEMKFPSFYANMKLKLDKSYLFGIGYRCRVSKCRKRPVIYKNKLINKPAIPIHKKMLALYKFPNEEYPKRIAKDYGMLKAHSTIS
ncbi:hypothetical protein DMUE_5042 [Dictyocoela muelleri]|nr:hypothetical protein DMUE_5042 [Dictyocoela muelleri]